MSCPPPAPSGVSSREARNLAGQLAAAAQRRSARAGAARAQGLGGRSSRSQGITETVCEAQGFLCIRTAIFEDCFPFIFVGENGVLWGKLTTVNFPVVCCLRVTLGVRARPSSSTMSKLEPTEKL